MSDHSPADLVFEVDSSDLSSWNYIQSKVGTWQVKFTLESAPDADATATLSTSFSGFSSGANLEITAQDGEVALGELSGLENDPSVYRSSTYGGVHRYYEFTVPAGTLNKQSKYGRIYSYQANGIERLYVG